MVVLDASRRNRPVPRLALWSLGAGIVATVGANLAHGIGHGPVGALVSAWPAAALVGSFELLSQRVPSQEQDAPPALTAAPTLEQTIGAWYKTGRSQRAVGRELHIDCRKVKRILDEAA